MQGGAVDCALTLGFEHMNPGALGSLFTDRPSPFTWFDEATDELIGQLDVPFALRYFGRAGKAHMDQYGTQLATFAKSAPRRAATRATTRSRCSATSSPKKRCSHRR